MGLRKWGGPTGRWEGHPRQGSRSNQMSPWTSVPIHAFLKQVLSAHWVPHRPSTRTKQCDRPAPCSWDHPGVALGPGALGLSALKPKHSHLPGADLCVGRQTTNRLNA